MKRKTFKEYLKIRLSSEEITEIKEQTLQEKNTLQEIHTNKHLGSSFDDLLKEEGTLETAELAAIKMVLVDQVTQEMKKKKLSQTEMIKRLGISEANFMQLLDPQDFSITLLTLYRIAAMLGKNLTIKFH